MSSTTSAIILLLTIHYTQAVYECCPEDNLLSLISKSCSTNDSIVLDCNNGDRIPITNVSRLIDFNYVIMDDGTMIDKTFDREIKYCHSYPEYDTTNISDHIYVICYEKTKETIFEENKYQVMAILGYVSLAFIILTIVVYAMVPKLLDLQGICIMHALVGLAAGYIFLGIVQLSSNLDVGTCNFVATLTYFSFLYLFFWLDILSFHIWRTTVNPQCLNHITKWKLIYHMFAIGGTLVFLLFLLIAHHSPSNIWDDIRPGFGEVSCWFKSMRETLIFFYGPISVLLFFNIVFYLWTVIVLWGRTENNQNKILRYRFKLCVRLFIIMGMTWTFEILTAALKNYQTYMSGKIFFFLLDLFNILQGLLIFLVLVVFRKKVRRALASKNLCNIQFPNSWRYLEDEEMESAEDRINCTVAEFKENSVEVKR